MERSAQLQGSVRYALRGFRFPLPLVASRNCSGAGPLIVEVNTKIEICRGQ